MSYLSIAKAKLNDLEMIRLFNESIRKIEQTWEVGTYEKVEGVNPVVSTSLYRAIDELDQIWAAVNQGKASLEDFKNKLDKWLEIHLGALAMDKLEG